MGVLGAAVTRSFARIGSAFTRTVAWFRERFPLPEIAEHTNSGRAALFLPRSGCDAEGRLYAGEAGGFSDFLLGFGIRGALQSGKLAAEAILSDADYDTLWQGAMGRRTEMGLADRFLYEQCGRFGYRGLLALAGRGDFRSLGRWLYSPHVIGRTCLPLAKRLWRGPVPEHLGERCAWIRRAADERRDRRPHEKVQREKAHV